MVFKINEPDYKQSPFTGMARKHWVECAKYLLEGVFSHVKSYDDPIIFPRKSDVIYPQKDAPWYLVRSMEMEGLARTFMLAAPLIKEFPDIEISSFRLKQYYKDQILSAYDPASERFIGKATEIGKENGNQPAQQLLESGSTCLGLLLSKNIWAEYSKSQKDQIAEILYDYAHFKTHPHNWRFFSVIISMFLKLNGYEINEDLMKNHIKSILAYYAGDGWYRDGTDFDYYTPWAFQFYGPVWCKWYGYEYEPELAGVFEKRYNEFIRTYPLMFGEDGHSIMWGRSGIYRFAASVPLASGFLLKNSEMNPGWARRIASGNLLQFTTNDKFLDDGVPTLGYYGQLDSMLQAYSCAASPFWLAKMFLAALSLDKDNPFWSGTEHDGQWSHLGEEQKTVILDRPGLVITDHGKTGAAELRSGKISLNIPPYMRLAFNSKFQWEDDDLSDATAMTYIVKRLDDDQCDQFIPPFSIKYAGVSDGVVYRRMNLINNWTIAGSNEIDLAEIIIPGGMIRIDRLKIPYPYDLRLGHFGFAHKPNNPVNVETSVIENHEAITVSNSDRSLAIISYMGWDKVDSITHTGKNIETEQSTVLYLSKRKEIRYSGPELVVTVMLHKTNSCDWTTDELLPIANLEYKDICVSGSPCGLELELKSGQKYAIDFGGFEGKISM